MPHPARRLALSVALLVSNVLLTSALSAAEAPVTLDRVVVTPSRFGIGTQAAPRAATLTGAELETLPQIGNDLYRAIARLPGLAVDDFSARFWVRGAPHGQLLARLDGVDLVEPFHLKDVDGALSIVDPGIIARLDLTTGGFTAEFGDRLAGVLTLDTRSPSARRTALELSLTGVGARTQGTFARNRGRWLASARRGYPDVALRVAGRDDDVTPRYYDLTGKLEYQLAPGHLLSAHVLHAADTLTYKRTGDPSLASSYDSDYAWTRWLATPSPGVSGETVLSFTRLAWARTGTGALDGFPFSLRDRRRLNVGGIRSDWSVATGEKALLRAGVEAKSGTGTYDYVLSRQQSVVVAGRQVVVPTRVQTALRPEGDSFGAFVSARARLAPGWVVEPGLRFDRQTPAHDANASPRLNSALTLGRATVRLAWGAYRQSQGLHELAVADGDTAFRRAELAEHRVVGLEYPLARGLGFRAEAYERLGTRLRPRRENLDNGYNLFPEVQSDRVRLDPRRSRARGVELLFAGRPDPRLSWNASYALARSEEELAGRWVPRAREQRHTFYTDATYVLNPRWQFSASWQFHTGWPTTDVVYALANLTNGRRVLVSANGPVYGLRLPDYHRLDLRATRRVATRHGDLRLYFDLFNAYDRTNAVGYDHRITVTGTEVLAVRKLREQLPLLPSVGAVWEF